MREATAEVAHQKQGNEYMIYAVSAQGKEITALVDPRFGRARFFQIINSDGGEQTAIDNESGMNARQGAGIQTVQMLAKLGVQAVVTGHVGPKAWTALQAANIPVYGISGECTVAEAMRAFGANELQPMTGATVAGHWQ